jgi:CO/xanthine dehydrogenase FAD-binding subunit
LEEARDIMRGNTITPKLIEEVSQIAEKNAHPVANTATEPRYRKQMARVLTKNAILEALDRIKKAP